MDVGFDNSWVVATENPVGAGLDDSQVVESVADMELDDEGRKWCVDIDLWVVVESVDSWVVVVESVDSWVVVVDKCWYKNGLQWVVVIESAAVFQGDN